MSNRHWIKKPGRNQIWLLNHIWCFNNLVSKNIDSHFGLSSRYHFKVLLSVEVSFCCGSYYGKIEFFDLGSVLFPVSGFRCQKYETQGFKPIRAASSPRAYKPEGRPTGVVVEQWNLAPADRYRNATFPPGHRPLGAGGRIQSVNSIRNPQSQIRNRLVPHSEFQYLSTPNPEPLNL